MTLFKNKYRIESNRWQFWDYSSPGSYFITVCVEDRKNILGQIIDSEMHLSNKGKIVSDNFLLIPTYNKRITLDEWIVMPNHFHCVISLGDYNFDNGISKINKNEIPIIDEIRVNEIRVNEIHVNEIRVNEIHEFHLKKYRKLRRRMIIPKIIGKFKMLTSKQINIIANTVGKKNWQRDYYDRVIQNDTEFQRIKRYIKNNPAKWNDDKLFNR